MPATSWPWSHVRARIRADFEGADVRVCLSFWLFGLINNILIGIILSAALDLVGPAIPKATVLLASIVPSFCSKLVVPYFIHLVPYSLRIWLLVVLATCGMLVIAVSPPSTDAWSVGVKIAGIVPVSLSIGAGDVNFIGLAHYYGPFSLAAWGSGSGAAGLLGSGAYALATNELGISPRAALLSSALFPAMMLISFFAVLPRAPLQTAEKKSRNTRQTFDVVNEEDGPRETTRLLGRPVVHQEPTALQKENHGRLQKAANDVRAKLGRAQLLLIPYMAPMCLVYLAEYTINQGVTPTLLFPLERSPFSEFRAFYPTYIAFYQAGVFVSRSSLAFFQIRTLYVPALLQVLNLSALTIHALYPFIPSVYLVFAIVLWEGLLGGLVYINSFARVLQEVPEDEREFSLGAVCVSDATGVCLAGAIGLLLETALCNWQVEHGRDWCRRR